ncbi:hypothetical protein C5167_015821 [Papaver somniferum]|uniref:Protein kinase domain-containing protein n=1 Tax=Papaver somniferum TaxID=3469 RepID=A0A4Y7J830_PAPSO|nr:hypothetical protein C5167_015821 [Papaver somniferum]
MALHILLNFQCFLVLLCLQLASTTEIPITASTVITKPGCQDKCGNVSIPHPFGIGDGCFIHRRFEIECNDSLPSDTRPVIGKNIPVTNISILDGEMTIRLRLATDCSDKSIQLVDNEISASFIMFTFSNTKNKFIAIGCNAFAYLVTTNDNASIATGCLSSCNKIEDSTNGTCNGIGCCEASIPAGLQRYEAIVIGLSPSGRRNLSFNPCSYAFLTEKSSFNFSSSYLENFRNHGTLPVPAVVDWTIGNQTCEEAQTNLTSYALWEHEEKKAHEKVKEEFFKQNGGLILNRLLDEREEDTENGRKGSKMGKGEKKHQSIATIYTEKELSKATKNYHDSQILGRGGFGTVYKGILSNGKLVAIKKTKIVNLDQNEQFISEIAVLSQINHKNVSQVPLLVYEYVGNGTLYQHLHECLENQASPAFLSWESRLRIASEVAGSLAYLHAEASIPIIHRDVKSSNVLLDDEYRAEVSDFGASRLNPTDQAQLSTIVQGKEIFSLDRPEEDRNLANYFNSSMKTNRLFAILDSSLVQNDNERVSSVHGHQQIQQTAELAQKCLRMKGENRPTMKEVAMILHVLMVISSSYHGILDEEDTMHTSRGEHMLLLESAELLSYTDSITTIGDSIKRISALETEGR